MLGVSIYLGKQSEKEQEEYLKTMSASGFESIFTSLHIPEDDPATYKVLLQTLATQAKTFNMELMADISPLSLKHLGVTFETLHELNSWGITGFRLDYGIEPEVIAALSAQMKVALNASTLDEEFYSRIKEGGLHSQQTEVWHNFYPRPETGLGKAHFIELNKSLAKKGFKVMAFVPGDKQLRGPLHEGLPTLEKHRNRPPFEAFLELTKRCFVDKVLIGDLSIEDYTLFQFKRFHAGVIPLRYHLQAENPAIEDIIGNMHRNRLDPARDVIRSETSRMYAQKGKISLEPFNAIERRPGYITIDNQKYGRYQGELQITLKDLPKDEKVNVVGKIYEEDLPLLQFIGAGQEFELIRAERRDK